MVIATGFDCEPLPDGTVLIEFFSDDGKTFNKQVVTQEVIRKMPLVALLTTALIERGPSAVERLMNSSSSGEEKTIQ